MADKELIMKFDPVSLRPVGTIDKKEAHKLIMDSFKNDKEQEFVHPHIGVVLCDKKRIIVFVRPFGAKENPDLMDKTLGGHLLAGYET